MSNLVTVSVTVPANSVDKLYQFASSLNAPVPSLRPWLRDAEFHQDAELIIQRLPWRALMMVSLAIDLGTPTIEFPLIRKYKRHSPETVYQIGREMNAAAKSVGRERIARTHCGTLRIDPAFLRAALENLPRGSARQMLEDSSQQIMF